MTENPTEPSPETVETNVPSQPPVVEETPPAAKAKAIDLKQPEAPGRGGQSLFSRETRTGRFFRGLLRAVLIILVLLALGGLAVFWFLYRPAAQELTGMRQTATQAASDVMQSQGQLSTAQQTAKDAQSQASQVKTQLDSALLREQVLRAQNAALTARLALAQNNKTAAAGALKDAQNGLAKIQTQLNQLDSKEYSTLQALFTLTGVDLDRDAKLADQDLARLQSELNRLDTLIPAQ